MKTEKVKKPRAKRTPKAKTAIQPMVIEKGIPIPPKTRTIKFAYPFKEMAAGDSFPIEYSEKNYRKLYTSAKNFAKLNPGTKFTLRTFKDANYIRCWRIK
jgi:hypothetical protein